MTQFASDEELFAGALAVPAAERKHFLARACAEDSVAKDRGERRKLVELMLATSAAPKNRDEATASQR